MGAASVMNTAVLIEDPAYPDLKQHVVKSTGLEYYSDKDQDLARRLGNRLATTGVEDCASYINLLRDPLRGPRELDALIAEITIGETYFFRHREHFDALGDRILPDIIERNRAKRSLRIWCAGSADGPEAYSIAIALSSEQQLAGWDLTILGTDINRDSLARAREGLFEEWALRSADADLRERCFLQEGKRWRIAPKFKNLVSFQYHNLVEDPFPSLLNNLCSFDLIFCRNVMIYFGPDLMRQIVDRLYQCLVPGGWLIVGPSEPNMTCFTAFRAVNAPGVTLYQRPHTAASTPDPAWNFFLPPLNPQAHAANPQTHACPNLPSQVPTNPPAADPPSNLHSNLPSHVSLGAPHVNAGTVETDATRAPDTPPTDLLLEARTQADRGAWPEALECCNQLLAQDNLNARAHFYRGLVLEQMRDHAGADLALRRAIYLDRNSVLAHYYSGLLLQSSGDPQQAARCFQNAIDLLDRAPENTTYADADNITARELKKLAQMHLQILK